MTCSVAYLRTSSATNVGGDSDKRQLAAIREYAARADFDIKAEFYDADVRGADRIDTRPNFERMLAWCSENDCKTIIFESASRLSRDLIVQETGYQLLKAQGYTLIASDSPDMFSDDSPTAVLIRQVLGAVSQFEKAALVAKLKGARERKRADTGRCEGPKPAPEAARAMANQLRGEGLTLRAIADRLADAGFLSPSGKTYLAGSIAAMLAD